MRGRRPNSITPDQRKQIVTSVRQCTPLVWAGPAAGVATSTLFHWLDEGRKDGAREPYRTFALDVDAARADAGKRILSFQLAAMVLPSQRTEDMGPYDAKEARAASAWVATHLYSDVFVPKTRTEVTGADGQPIESNVTVTPGVVVLPTEEALDTTIRQPAPGTEQPAAPRPFQPSGANIDALLDQIDIKPPSETDTKPRRPPTPAVDPEPSGDEPDPPPFPSGPTNPMMSVIDRGHREDQHGRGWGAGGAGW